MPQGWESLCAGRLLDGDHLAVDPSVRQGPLRPAEFFELGHAGESVPLIGELLGARVGDPGSPLLIELAPARTARPCTPPPLGPPARAPRRAPSAPAARGGWPTGWRARPDPAPRQRCRARTPRRIARARTGEPPTGSGRSRGAAPAGSGTGHRPPHRYRPGR